MLTLSSRKKPSQTQRYENYWKLTLEYSDINGEQFSTTLELIIYFIDSNWHELKIGYSSKLYKDLQKNIEEIYPKADSASTRKSINQFVKLGFVEPYLKGYKKEAISFLNAASDEERELIFSEVYYKYSSFNSAVTKDDTNTRQINFLLKTLMYHPEQQLTKNEIIALMTVDISKFKKGFLSYQELQRNMAKADQIEFISRKYNQVNYFSNLLPYIPGIRVSPDKTLISYTEDATVQLSDTIDVSRDPTMFRIMKEKIKQESKEIYGTVLCYLTKREQKGLVVSHIWKSSEALRVMDIDAAYDPNNALILEPTTDQYFDKYDMTIARDGNPIFNKEMPDELVESLINLKLDDVVLNPSRKKYLDIHAQKYVEKNKSKFDD